MLHYKTLTIKVSWLWLPSLCLLPYLHVSKIIFFIFFILSIHEASHMVVAKLCHYTIEEVTIYPFGLSATIPELGYGSLIKEIMIIGAGPLSQIIFPIIFRVFVSWELISPSFCAYLMMMNSSIMIFNLLPIYPLDGGRLLQAFFHSFLRYRRAQQFTCIASLIILTLLLFTHVMQGVSAWIVQLFLLFQIILCWKEIMHMQLRFYHFRYLHPVQLPIIMNTAHDLYRGRYNLMRTEKGWMKETLWLSQWFSSDRKK